MNTNDPLPVERNKGPKKGKNGFAHSPRDVARKNRTKVFLSYVKEDKLVVDKIIAFLRQIGCEPWSCENDLLPGQLRDSQIRKNIEQSDFFIACLSKKYIQASGVVQIELNCAGKVLEQFPEEKIFVIPIRLDNCNMPGQLESRQWVDWHDLDAKIKIRRAMGAGVSKHREAR